MILWARRFRIRAWVRTSAWFIPSLYVVVAILLGLLVPRADARGTETTGLPLDPDSVRGMLGAIATGMITFTGLVFSIYLVMVQWGSSAFSPRLIRWLGRDALPKHALGTFIATFLFALIALAEVGIDSDTEYVPEGTLIVSLGWVLLSVTMFVALLNRVLHSLRVASITQHLGAQARDVFDDVYPDPYEAGATSEEVDRLLASERVQTIRSRSSLPSVVVAIDRVELTRRARDADAMLRLVPAVGDHLPSGAPLLEVYGPDPIPERMLERSVVLGDERTIDHDPTFAVRVLVDIAVKALSPGVNDPTTATQVLDQLSDVLGYASTRRLDMGVVRDSKSRARLVYPTPGWEDLLALALDEIRVYGAASIQVMRRMRAVLEHLEVTVPEARRTAVREHLARLDRSVERSFPDPDDRRDASVADVQGLGLGALGEPRRSVTPG